MTTPTTTWLEPGQIRTAHLALRLADGTTISDSREVLILDTRPDEEGTRVLWQAISGVDRLPGGDPHWSVIDDLGDPAPYHDVIELHLHVGTSVVTGTYVPRDPELSSLEILRDQAIARVDYLRRWHADHRPADLAEATAAYRAAEADRDAAQTHLRERIREAIDRGVSVQDISTTTGLSRERIYQIRDGRR